MPVPINRPPMMPIMKAIRESPTLRLQSQPAAAPVTAPAAMAVSRVNSISDSPSDPEYNGNGMVTFPFPRETANDPNFPLLKTMRQVTN